MKKIRKCFYMLLTTLVVYLISYQTIIGQTVDQTIKSKNYKAWITTINDNSTIMGYMSEVGDSTIVIYNMPNFKKQVIHLKNIKEIKFRKKERAEKGVLYGTLTGFAIGWVIGQLVEVDDPYYPSCFSICFSADQKALFDGIGFSAAGALIGGIIGAIKIKIPINGNASNQKEKLLKYKLSF